jgi:hypothetical protein
MIEYVSLTTIRTASSLAQTKPHHGGEQTGDVDTREDGHDDMYHSKGGYNGRFTETSAISARGFFQDNVFTALPHVDVTVAVPGCKEIYMQQDQLLLRMAEMSTSVS